MSRSLLENAIDSIQLGIEDYQANNPKRAISAARNYFAGVLLLAKAALVAAAPDADPDILLSSQIDPVPDGHGGAAFRGSSSRTIDFNGVGRRLRAFGVAVDMKSLDALQAIRNDIEHSKNPHSATAVREAIASSFPVVRSLCDGVGGSPIDLLGSETWSAMLNAKFMYDAELAQAVATFASVKWPTAFTAQVPRVCPECGSALIAQVDAENTDFQSADLVCRACGEELQPEAVLEHSVEEMFDFDIHRHVHKGGEPLVHDCPECGVAAYLTTEEHVGCVWCGEELGECAVCHTELTPENVSWDNSSLCSYHADVLSRDD